MLFTNLSQELRELYHEWGIEHYFDDDMVALLECS
jgi:hypothetical protein